MIGAIYGDMVGAPYEFMQPEFKSKEFEMFTKDSQFTDDTVMTIAIADTMIDIRKNHISVDNIGEVAISKMQDWGRKYPNAGYGYKFIDWLYIDNPEPYNSCGNGAAMRISSVSYISEDLKYVREVARLVTEVSHNHPEGIKAAEAVVCAIWMARHRYSKKTIKEFIEKEFDYDLSRTLDEIRPDYYHIELSQESVPEAIICWLESTSYEDAIRNAISLGGDADTLACIAGSIAEAEYGLDPMTAIQCIANLPQDMVDVVFNFMETFNVTYTRR